MYQQHLNQQQRTSNSGLQFGRASNNSNVLLFGGIPPSSSIPASFEFSVPQASVNPTKLKLHPLENEYVATINIGADKCKVQSTDDDITTIVILDRSGSMGDSARRIVNEILPEVFALLSYDNSKIIHLITFESVTEHKKIQVNNLKTTHIISGGGTNFAPAIRTFHDLLIDLNSSPARAIRLLVISDGIIDDVSEVEKRSQQLMDFVSQSSLIINSQAVRFFTNLSNQPDTKALCSLLQINNKNASRLLDIQDVESNSIVAKKIANLFQSDQLETVSAKHVLKSDSSAIYKHPWDMPVSEMTLLPGKNNIFWLKSGQNQTLKVDNQPVQIEKQNPLNLETFHAMMKPKLNYLSQQIKILKVTGTEESKRKAEEIINYFDEKENLLANLQSNLMESERPKLKKISNTLRPLAQDNVRDMDSNQQADYIDSSRKVNEVTSLFGAVNMSNDSIPKSETTPIAPQISSEIQSAPNHHIPNPKPFWITMAKDLGIDIESYSRTEKLLLILIALTVLKMLLK